jgi:FtsH-binding integral membrane protein
LIVEKNVSGDNDYAGHAMRLFVDFVAIFVRLLIILSRNSEKKRSERK